MPPRVATRTVRLHQSPRAAAHTERLKLLTYPMALAQRGATAPLIHSPTMGADHGNSAGARLADSLSCFSRGGGGSGARLPPTAKAHGEVMEGPFSVAAAGKGGSDATGAQSLPAPRRWVRDADELCVASIHRSNNVNRINSYVATYKFDDPQWRPLLLPEVHVLPKARTVNTEALKTKDAQEQQSSAKRSYPLSSSQASNTMDGYDVFIDYNKLTMLELMSRHANYALRHLVQKGHAMYLVTFAQHSVLQMRGLVEASYVRCAYGIRGERLRTHIIHTGPVDVREVLEIHPETLRVSFNFCKPHVRRGVVAVSTVEGYGTWFQRKPMLWQRTRRIGALQSQMGSYDYQLCDCAEVGRIRPYEVSLLAPHVRLIGSEGGADAVALVASSQVAQNQRLYMGQFEAPVLTAVDAVHQLIHRIAVHHQLLRPAVVEEAGGSSAAPAAAALGDSQLEELRRLAGMERLLPVSWVTRTPPPYVPLEADLPFRIQLSRPAVIRTDAGHARPSRGSEDDKAAVTFPTGGSVGSPFVRGVPLSLFEYNIHQGVDHYVFDDAPSARPLKWWNQKSNMPYSGYVYGVRSGLLNYVEPAEVLPNPLAPPTREAVPAPPGTSARRRRRRAARGQRHASSCGGTVGAGGEGPPAQSGEGADAVQPGAPRASCAAHTVDPEGDMKLNLGAEVLAAGAEGLNGYEDSHVQEAALTWAEDGMNASVADRPPLHTLVPPTSAAQRRLRRYARARSTSPQAFGTEPSSCGTLDSRADALLQRQRWLRRMRRRQEGKGALPLPPEGSARPLGTTSEKMP
ncbi:hypothetical protein LSCM1_06842 [Leishmania martiniquensis]|uniref:Uncharacterized protein n=1 Tax=Leishmania martiniquensis TaxID=1580590 RepID=A0A836KRE9_9TRYP|nr:hypothetical protein LSCM1_06842 [Leishmania martiniquensis]